MPDPIILKAEWQLLRTVAVADLPDDDWVADGDLPPEGETFVINEKSPNFRGLAYQVIPLDGALGDPVLDADAARTKFELVEIATHRTGKIAGYGDETSNTNPQEILLDDRIGVGEFTIRISAKSGSFGSATHLDIMVKEL